MTRTEYLTRTSAVIALLVTAQFVTKSMGQIVTGSSVNFLLALAALTFGLKVSAPAALLSPFLAFLLGIGPNFIQIVPCIAATNLLYCYLMFCFVSYIENHRRDRYVRLLYIPAVIAAALMKCLTLNTLVIGWIAPAYLPDKVLPVLSVSFGILQFYTAFIGGTAASQTAPYLKEHLLSR